MDITITLTQAQVDLLEPLIEVPEEGPAQTIEQFVQDATMWALADRAHAGSGYNTAMQNAYDSAVAPVNAAFGTNFTWV